MLNPKPIKVIIDTNLWISFLIGKELSQLKALIVEDEVQPVFSEESLEELKLVTQRPKLQKYFPKEKVDELLHFLKAVSVLVKIESKVAICRDPKDNYLLAMAKDSQANYLVTSDQDLLILEKFYDTKIITYRKFFQTIFGE